MLVAHLVADPVEHGREVAHVRAGEDGREHLALPLVMRTLGEQKPRAHDNIAKPKKSERRHVYTVPTRT